MADHHPTRHLHRRSSSGTMGMGTTTNGGEIGHFGEAAHFYENFECLEVLGEGLSSVVRRCIDRKTSVEYAVKIIDVTKDNDIHEGLNPIQQVQREVEILKRLQGHPYIIQLVESYQTPDFIFLVFELCRQGELYELLNSNVRLSEKRVRNFMKQLLLAVQFCHENGVIHRDIKPENILIQDDLLHIKLMDFGLSAFLKPQDKLYELCGTPVYLAPEIYVSGMFERSNPKCVGYSYPVDAWACGVIMFTLLIGRPPFYNKHKLRMIKDIQSMHHCYTGLDWETVTDDAKDLINGLLDKNPNTRMTIEEALNHDVFAKPVLLRNLNPGGAYADILNTEEVQIETGFTTKKKSSLLNHIQPGRSQRKSGVILPSTNNEDRKSSVQLSYREKVKHPSVIQKLSSTAKRLSASVNSSLKSESSTKSTSTLQASESKFNPRRQFRSAVTAVTFVIRLSRLGATPELINLGQVRANPYGLHSFRKCVDGHAFRLYQHWLKKSDFQSGAAMFQNKIKDDKVSSASAVTLSEEPIDDDSTEKCEAGKSEQK